MEDAGVLEEAADDGADADVVRESLDAGTENREAANDEVDFDAGLRGLIERLMTEGSRSAFILATMCAGWPA